MWQGQKQNKNTLTSCKALILDEPNYRLSLGLEPEQSQSEKAKPGREKVTQLDKFWYKLTFTDQITRLRLANQFAFPYYETIISELSHNPQTHYFLQPLLNGSRWCRFPTSKEDRSQDVFATKPHNLLHLPVLTLLSYTTEDISKLSPTYMLQLPFLLPFQKQHIRDEFILRASVNFLHLSLYNRRSSPYFFKRYV